MATNKCRNRKKGSCSCPICDDLIEDETQQSIFCEGICNTWLHRCCAGLSKAAFSRLEGSTEKFYCPHCRLQDQAVEISCLKEALASLQRDVAALQDLQTTVNQSVASSPEEPVLSNPRGPLTSTRPRHPSNTGSDRKFNLIVSGIEECAYGTTRRDRLSQDNEKLSSLLTSLLPNFSDQSVRDCSRLGRYSSDRTRPLLVVLNRSCDVTTVLSNKSSLANRPNIKVNRDLPPVLGKLVPFCSLSAVISSVLVLTDLILKLVNLSSMSMVVNMGRLLGRNTNSLRHNRNHLQILHLLLSLHFHQLNLVLIGPQLMFRNLPDWQLMLSMECP